VLADAVEPFALSALKYGLFALLFLFLWRSMRWVVRGLNVDRSVPAVAVTKGPTTRTSGGSGSSQPDPITVMVHADGAAKPRATYLATNTVVGRGAECDLRLDDTFVSQEHARIFAKDGSWYVEDLGSTNGTFVNEQRLAAPAMLTSGDRIRVGTTVLELAR
jgi:pSer/pThr/pTyr-binding forkhead associated (FHA) protein